jgi:hypothetical protein
MLVIMEYFFYFLECFLHAKINMYLSTIKKKFSVVNKQEMWDSTCIFMKCHNISVFPIKLEDIPGTRTCTCMIIFIFVTLNS